MTERSEAYPLSDDPLWFKDVIFYEVHVRTFLDSNEDGIGDFNELTEKLDYLQDLGITAIGCCRFTHRRCATTGMTLLTIERSILHTERWPISAGSCARPICAGSEL